MWKSCLFPRVQSSFRARCWVLMKQLQWSCAKLKLCTGLTTHAAYLKPRPRHPASVESNSLRQEWANKRLKHMLEFYSTAAVRPSRGCFSPRCRTRRRLCGREPPGPDPHTTLFHRFSCKNCGRLGDLIDSNRLLCSPQVVRARIVVEMGSHPTKRFLFNHTTPFSTKGHEKSLCDFTGTIFVQCENPVISRAVSALDLRCCFGKMNSLAAEQSQSEGTCERVLQEDIVCLVAFEPNIWSQQDGGTSPEICLAYTIKMSTERDFSSLGFLWRKLCWYLHAINFK